MLCHVRFGYHHYICSRCWVLKSSAKAKRPCCILMQRIAYIFSFCFSFSLRCIFLCCAKVCCDVPVLVNLQICLWTE